jgi:hypothetical protein
VDQDRTGRIREVIRAWRPFLNEKPSETGQILYRIYHSSFQEFLGEEGVGLQQYHRQIAEAALHKIPGFVSD